LGGDETALATADQISETRRSEKSKTAAATPKVANAALISRTNVAANAVNRIISISQRL